MEVILFKNVSFLKLHPKIHVYVNKIYIADHLPNS